MANLSASKIYQKAYPNKEKPFGKWIEEEKMNYESRNLKMDFDSWLNRRWAMKLAPRNADGEQVEQLNSIGDVLSQVNEAANTIKTTIGVPDSKVSVELAKQNEEAAIAKENKTILGLSPFAAYAIGTVALLGIGLLVYKMVKRPKK